MTVLVTGGGGFIGSHLVEALLSSGAEVRALVRYNSRNDWGNLEHLKSGAEGLDVRPGDITDARLVATVFGNNDIDAVLHLVAESHVDRSIEGAAPFVRSEAW